MKQSLLVFSGFLLIFSCSKSSTTSSGGGGTTALSTAQRAQATTTTAQTNSSCTALGDFYWEIGDKTGILGSGAIGATYSGSSLLSIASASKWIFGAYVIARRNGILSAADLQALQMGTGYVSFTSCTSLQTVAGCFSSSPNNTQTAGDINHFYYGVGHFQDWGNSDSTVATMGVNSLDTEFATYLGSDIMSTNTMRFTSPQFAGGLAATPSTYGVFLRKILNSQLLMSAFLNYSPVCTLPGTCATAVYSPAPLNWHYSVAHWIEDDATGDGAFSSAGAYGFYPWIDSTKTYYGILARQDTTDAGNPVLTSSYWMSGLCGQKLRAAWVSGVAQ